MTAPATGETAMDGGAREPLRRALLREDFARCNGGGAWSEFRDGRAVMAGLMVFSGLDAARADGAGGRRRPC